MIILPIFSESTAFDYEIDLDGRLFNLRFVYSGRYDSWTVSVRTPDAVELASGVPLVVGVDLLSGYPDRSFQLPDGLFMVITLDKVVTDPGRYGFDLGHRLVYYEVDDIPKMPKSDLRIYDTV